MSRTIWIPFASIVARWRKKSQSEPKLSAWLDTTVVKWVGRVFCNVVNWPFNTLEGERQTDVEPCGFCLLESRLCMDLLDDERRWLEETLSCWEQTGLTNLLLYTLSPRSIVFTPSGCFFPGLPLHSLPLFLSAALTALSWRGTNLLTDSLCTHWEMWVCAFFDSTGLTRSVTVWLNIEIWKTP